MGMTAKNWDISNGVITAEISGLKLRSCELIQGTTMGYVAKDGIVKEVPFSVSQDIKNSPRSINYKISFGNWKWVVDSHTDISVMTTMKYSCGNTIINETVGPFEVPR